MPRTNASEEDEYEVPETFLKLDEVAVPSPILSVNPGFNFFPNEDEGPSGRKSSAAAEDLGGATNRKSPVAQGKEGMGSQNTSLHPDEEKALPPSESATTDDETADKLTALPRQDSWGHSGDRPIEELNVPAPASIDRDERFEPLEDRRVEKSETAGSSFWQSPRAKRVVQLMNALYTLSYLVIFSIFGTLARVGLQALTSFPGAPVTTPVLWANFAGSLIMGFLSEDRQLFMEEHGEKTNARIRYMERLKERRSQRRQERDLIKGSRRYSQQAAAGVPFTNSTTARLYPKQRTFSSRLTHRQSAAPSVISDQTAQPDPEEEKKRHNAVKKTLPLYIGLATGFCGSLTSFSSFMRDGFLALSNDTPSFPTQLNGMSTAAAPRNGGYSFLALLAVLIYEPAISLAGLYVGGHLALGLDGVTFTIPYKLTNRVLDRLALPLAVAMWAGCIILAIFPPDGPGGPASGSGSTWDTETWRGSVLMALAFAPAGCIARFYISMLLNSRFPAFPLGTFAVNVLGSALLAAFYALQHVSLNSSRGTLSGLGVSAGGTTPNSGGGNRLGCQLLQGAMDGFCGCFTTVSTWVAELNGLKRQHAWVYGTSSVVAGLTVTVIGMGPVRWGKGFEAAACGL